MGPTGAGKSTVARALAARLCVPFGEADDLHPPANIAAMRAGRALTDEERWPWLRDVTAWLKAHPDGVMACSALKRSYRDVLRTAGDVIFIHPVVSVRQLRRRVTSRSGHFMPGSLVDSQLEILEPLGEDEHGLTLVEGTVEATVEAAITWLRRPEGERQGAQSLEGLSPLPPTRSTRRTPGGPAPRPPRSGRA